MYIYIYIYNFIYFSHTAERVLHTQASLTFNQLKNTKLQFKQLSLMQNYLNITL